MTSPAPRRCCPCPPPGQAAGMLLCDCPPDGGDCTQFVRVYAADGTTTDFALDGGEYTPIPGGTVGACGADGTGRTCESPTTPVAVTHLCLGDGTPIAVVVQRDCDGTVSSPSWINLLTATVTPGPVPAGAGSCDQVGAAACDTTTPITTTGLCLADGTPIATVAQRDCDGAITQTGWLNLTTGAYTAGLPPAGAVACGAGQSIQVSGVFCDVDPATGDVYALVLVEYTYDEAGAVESVRLVRADDGTTYELQGELSICPGTATAMDVQTELLCLRDAAGELIQEVLAEYGYDTTTGARLFLRFTDPTTGAVVAPPADATVGVCGEPCQRCETVVLCHTPPTSGTPVPTSEAAVTVTAVDPATSGVPLNYGGPIAAPLPDAATFFAGGAANVGPNAINEHVYMVGSLALDPDCGDLDPAGTSELTITARITNTGANCGCGLWGRFSVWDTAGPTNLAAGLAPPNQDGNLGVLGDAATASICPGDVWEPSRTVTVANSAILAGTVRVDLNVQTGTDTTPDGTGCPVNNPGGTTYTLDQFSATVTPVPVVGCSTPGGPGEAVPFLRQLCRDCDGTVTTTDTELDGVTPYDTSTGTVGTCPSGLDPCDQYAGTVCYQGAEVNDPSGTPTRFNLNDPTFPGCWVSTGADPSYQYNEPVTAWEATYRTNTGSLSNVDFEAPEIGGGVQWANFTPPIPPLPDPPAAPPYVGTVVQNGITITLEITGTGAVRGADFLRLGNLEHVKISFSEPVTLNVQTQGFGDPVDPHFERFCDVVAVGEVVGTGETRHGFLLRDCATGATTVYDAETGAAAVEPVIVDCPTGCRHCTERVLCDDAAPATPATITGTVATGTLPNGITWQVRGTNANWPALESNADGGWWGIASFPNPPIGPATYTFNRPVDVVFSLALHYNGLSATQTSVQVPIGSEPVALPPGYHYNPTTGVVSGDETLTACPPITDPTKATSARFRLRGVTTFTLQFLGARVAACGQFGNFAFGGIEVTPAPGQFLRTVCRDCDGQIIGTPVDTALDGTTPYVPRGNIGACEGCQGCDTLTLCDVFTTSADLNFYPIAGGSGPCWAPGASDGSGGPCTLPNGVVVDPGTGFVPLMPAHPDWLVLITQARLGVNAPVKLRFAWTVDAGQGVQMPPGTHPITLHPLHSWDPATRTLLGLTGASNDGLDQWSTFYVPYYDGTGTWRYNPAGGATASGTIMSGIEVAPADPVTFLRTVCRDCNGAPGAAVDTLPDGITPYEVQGQVMDCGGVPSATPCTAVQLCVQPTVTETLEFITNEAGETGGQHDGVWTWSLESDQASWWPMYHSPPNSEWTSADQTSGTRIAHWVAPHPNNSTITTGASGEGPTIGPVPINWVAKASFDLPADAYPESIRISSSVIAADQIIHAYRLNDGPWQLTGNETDTGGPGNYKPPVYTFAARELPGAQPGTNTLFLRIRETVAGPSAGLKAHLTASYQRPEGGQRSWTRVMCGAGVHYLDDTGERAELPEFWRVVPCCCAGDTATEDVPLSTGIRRLTGATGPQTLVAEFPGVQSVTLTVIAGDVAVTMTDGTGQLVPAGVSLTWSVNDTDDASLAEATFDGQAGSDYLLHWTRKTTAEG